MTKRLKYQNFLTNYELVNFVNENKITQENIQNIILCKNALVLFYWEVKV